MTSMRRVKLELFLTVCLCMLTFVESRSSGSVQLRQDLRRLSSSVASAYQEVDEDAYDDDDEEYDSDEDEDEDDDAEEELTFLQDDADDGDDDEDDEDDAVEDGSNSTSDSRIDLRTLMSPTTIRVVGGTEVPLDKSSYKFVASLQRGKTNFPYCGGSLISKRFVMTAGHCVKTISPDRVVIGNFDLSDSKAGEIRTVKKVIRHPSYSGVTNDIALLYLSAAVDNIDPVVLSQGVFASPQEEDNQLVTAVGWGYTSEGAGVIQDRLREVDVPIVSQSKCSKSYAGIDETKICAGYEYDGYDSCSGDSGGPLFYSAPVTGEITQVGIVSYGRGCARAGFYGVYARPSAFIDWIEETLSQYGEELTTEHGTLAPTSSPTQAPTISDDEDELAEYAYCTKYNNKRVRVEMQSEMNFCHVSNAQRCSEGDRAERCFWNPRNNGYFSVPYLRNKCLPVVFKEVFP
ncbi:Serine protease 44 [Hondaea fermentalgiana]|uniref:Serine protease 44 n=1 Tax=Hondaea fermentalgiana TaxID=2315210 RepID=A0A2R5G5P6_9STRA|nr:Serine protease 44 [Hondaea fermentalgiana]|eukprot:GBG26356.1 Serine protease 44 [Hondaea fermentalgiana]